MDTTKELLGGRIKELRKQRGLTQDQLSEIIGIDPKHVSRIEVGRSFPSLDTLEKIASALNVEFKDFFEYFHAKDVNTLRSEILQLVQTTPDDKLDIIFRVIRAIVR